MKERMNEAAIRTRASVAALLVACCVSCGPATHAAPPKLCTAVSPRAFARPADLRDAPACVLLMDEIRVRTFAWAQRGGYTSTDFPESWSIWRKKLGPRAFLATTDVSRPWDEELPVVVLGDERSDFTADQLDALKSAGARSPARLFPGAVGVTARLGYVLCLAQLDFVREVDGDTPTQPGGTTRSAQEPSSRRGSPP